MKIQICFDFFTCKSSLEYSVSMSKLIICTYIVLPTKGRKKLLFFYQYRIYQTFAINSQKICFMHFITFSVTTTAQDLWLIPLASDNGGPYFSKTQIYLIYTKIQVSKCIEGKKNVDFQPLCNTRTCCIPKNCTFFQNLREDKHIYENKCMHTYLFI